MRPLEFSGDANGEVDVPSGPATKLSSLCVLVVEDEVLIRATIADELRSAGFQVVEANNAHEAIKFIKTGEPVAAVFSDVQMPGSMNGAQMAELLKRDHPSIPVILTSGHVTLETVNDPERFIPKPYRSEMVVAEIIRLVDLRDDKANIAAC